MSTYAARDGHCIVEISFADGALDCQCGLHVLGATPELLAKAYQDHRLAVGFGRTTVGSVWHGTPFAIWKDEDWPPPAPKYAVAPKVAA